MKRAMGERNLFLAVFLTLIGLHLFLMAGLRLYPFVDLPHHLASATIFRFYGEPTNEFTQYYALELFPKPNIFYLVFCGWKIFPSVEFANKVFYGLYVLLLPLSVLLVIRRLGGNPWFSLLALLVLYNLNVGWGFVGFTIAIPFVLLFFYFLLDYQENPRPRGMVIVTILFFLLFLMHAQATLFALLLFFTCSLYRRGKAPARLLKEGMMALPVLILIAVWWMSETAGRHPSTGGFLLDYYKGEYWRTLAKRKFLFFYPYDLYEGLWGRGLALFLFLLLSVPIFGWLIRHGKSLLGARRDGRSDRAVPAFLLLLCSLACFLVLPDQLPDQQVIYERFTVFFLLSSIIVGSLVWSRTLYRVRIGSIIAVCLLHFILWAGYFHDFAQENACFTGSVFPDNAAGKRLAGLIYDFRFRDQPVYIHFPDYYIVWKQGIASTSLIDYPFGPVRRKAAYEALPDYLDWVEYEDDYDGRYAGMDYILVRGNLPPAAQEYFRDFKWRTYAAPWTLYERRP